MNYTSTMQFIELFHQHRALWDRNDVNYLNKAERMRQREEIGYAMGMTEVDVGKKICNLRTYYLREMVKRDKALEYGQETVDSYVPKWPYFDALDSFLQDVVRKKRNELLTAGGSFQELPFVYTADDHLSDNDGADEFPDTSDFSRDSPQVADGGDREGRRLSQTKANDPTACDNDSDNDPPPKRPKLEPEDEYPITMCADGEDRGTRDKEVRSAGPGSPGSCLGAGVPLPRTSPYRMQPPPLSTSLGVQPGASLHRFPAGRGPSPALSVISPSSIPAQGVEGPRLNGHSLGGSIVGGTAASNHAGHLQRVTAGGVVMEEDEDWLFGRYIAAELKKIKSFKDKQLTKMRIQQIVTYAQLGMGQQNDGTGNSACSDV